LKSDVICEEQRTTRTNNHIKHEFDN